MLSPSELHTPSTSQQCAMPKMMYWYCSIGIAVTIFASLVRYTCTLVLRCALRVSTDKNLGWDEALKEA